MESSRMRTLTRASLVKGAMIEQMMVAASRVVNLCQYKRQKISWQKGQYYVEGESA